MRCLLGSILGVSVAAVTALAPTRSLAQARDIVAGKVRIQVLSPTLVRIEEAGPKGFEDRNTFRVVQRSWPGAKADVDAAKAVRTKHFTVTGLSGAETRWETIRVLHPNGTVLFDGSKGLPTNGFLPGPAGYPGHHAMADSPRMVPASWGATPPPPGASGGWDRGNDARDVYVFVNPDYRAFRKEFLRLTGPIPVPPLYAFGFIDSRYHPYTEQEALASIDEYRRRGIPLDMFVVDTDWRIGASHGYAVNEKLFPNMKRFIDEAHRRGVRLMYNDHPDPQYPDALDPRELQYRWDGLTGLMGMGMDVWWYDRNWSTSLVEPMPGIRKEVWGQALYHDITKRFRPDRRPLIMTNVQGIDNGRRNYAADPASHRYPIWWTGDTRSTFEFLRLGVQNGVDSGVGSLLPYVHEDLGGHFGGPTAELYVRFLEFGCLSPITRVHCTRGEDRHPWAFGAEAERIVTEYIKLRYRLLPTIYTAARRAYDDGAPILRRCDLEWPRFKEAGSNTQYLLGDDILVAPIVESVAGDSRPLPPSIVRSSDTAPGWQAEYFDNPRLEGQPALVRKDAKLDFDWKLAAPAQGIPQDNFSVRWTASVGPMPATGEYRFVAMHDDGARVYVDGKRIIDAWRPSDHEQTAGVVRLEAGKSYDVKVEYYEGSYNAAVSLTWQPPTGKPLDISVRSAWIPPGQWQDAWTGAIIEGPRTITVRAGLDHTPMWIRRGGILFMAPPVQRTWDAPLSSYTIDAYEPASGRTARDLYEDDGLSPDYEKGESARTVAEISRSGRETVLQVGATKGSLPGLPEKRDYVVRIHVRDSVRPARVLVNGRAASAGFIRPSSIRMPLGGAGASDGLEGGSVVEVLVKDQDVRRGFRVVIER